DVPTRSGVRYLVRRSLSFLLASALLLAGLALAGFEITHAEALRPFVLIGALVIIGAAGLWLVDEFGGALLRRCGWKPRRGRLKPGRHLPSFATDRSPGASIE